MQKHFLGDTASVMVTTHNALGAAANADATPTVTVFKNGTAVVALTDVNMTAIATGLYRYAVALSVAAGFAHGDIVEIVATATVDGVTSKAAVYAVQVAEPVDVGVTTERGIRSLMSQSVNVRTFNEDGTSVGYKRDGVTPDTTVKLGTTPGNITESTLH